MFTIMASTFLSACVVVQTHVYRLCSGRENLTLILPHDPVVCSVCKTSKKATTSNSEHLNVGLP